MKFLTGPLVTKLSQCTYLCTKSFHFTELSYASQSLNTIKDLLFDRNLETVETSVDELDSSIDDLLQYLNKAMNHEREVI